MSSKLFCNAFSREQSSIEIKSNHNLIFRRHLDEQNANKESAVDVKCSSLPGLLGSPDIGDLLHADMRHRGVILVGADRIEL